MMLKYSEIMVANLSPIMKITPRNCGPCCCEVHEEAPEADIGDIGTGVLHDGVNVTVCVDVSITVDTTGCGLSTGTIMSSVNRVVTFFCKVCTQSCE